MSFHRPQATMNCSPLDMVLSMGRFAPLCNVETGSDEILLTNPQPNYELDRHVLNNSETISPPQPLCGDGDVSIQVHGAREMSAKTGETASSSGHAAGPSTPLMLTERHLPQLSIPPPPEIENWMHSPQWPREATGHVATYGERSGKEH